MLAPVLARARGFARSSISFPPPMRGDGAPTGAVSGFRRTARRISPGGSLPSLAHRTDAPASADAPLRYLSAFAFLGARSMRGPTPRTVLPGAARWRGYEFRPR